MQILNPDNTSDRDQWIQLWQASGREPFAHPGYVELYADEDTDARCALYETDMAQVFYPFLLRSIPSEIGTKPANTPAFDIISPYGYGGPLLVEKQPEKRVAEAGNTPHSIQKEQKKALSNCFYHYFHRWAQENSIVSEFVRFFLFSEAIDYYYGLVEHNNDNIVVSLNRTDEELWRSFRHKVRKNVRKALKRGLTVEEDPPGERLDDFLNVYYHTLDRRNATDFYYFDKDFLTRSVQTLSGNSCFFHVKQQGQVIASELVLMSDSHVYSFLGGTLADHFDARPTDLLKYHITKWARINGFSHFIIGGGHKPHDGIFAFKEAFAPGSIRPFHTGKMIFDEKMYLDLNGKISYDGFFPAYRDT